MTLFEIIYNFFRFHVFSQTSYVGTLINVESEAQYDAQLGFIYLNNNNYSVWDSNEGALISGLSISLGDYLCLIATIISMVVIVILCCLLIKKIYNICAHIIG